MAALYGFLFALWVITGFAPWIFFLPLITFLPVLAAFKIVSLSSILSSFAAMIYVWAIGADASIICAAAVFFVLILLRHGENIRRMMSGTENQLDEIKHESWQRRTCNAKSKTFHTLKGWFPEK